MTRRQVRTQNLGDGIRVDHRSSCSAVHPRCTCPKSWAGRQQNGARAKRRTGFVGTFTEAKIAKGAEAADARRVGVAVTLAPPVEQATMPTLYEFARMLLSDPLARKPITTDRYADAYRLRIHPHLGYLRLDEITPRICRNWCDELVRREGDRICAKKAAKTLIWLLNEAIAEDHLTGNPALGMKFERRARAAVADGAPSAAAFAQKKPALNRPRYELLKSHAASVGVRELVMVRLTVEGTLRRNELLGLQWSGYDRINRTFAVLQGVTYAPSVGTATGDPKTKKSRRVIVLSRDLIDCIDLYRRTRQHGTEADNFVFPGYLRYANTVDPTKPLNPDTASDHLLALIRDSGLVDDHGKHYTDVIGLRGTGNSIAAAAGVPKPLRQAQMGHSGNDLNERVYTDVSEAPERFQFADVFEPREATLGEAVDQSGGSDGQVHLF